MRPNHIKRIIVKNPNNEKDNHMHWEGPDTITQNTRQIDIQPLKDQRRNSMHIELP